MSKKYLIIGAGASGLAAASAFQKEGVHFEIVEKYKDLGGIWDIERPDTPMYQSAHFISSRKMSQFPDFPMPENYPKYPNHQQIYSYLHSYADHYDLKDRIHFNTEVEKIKPDSKGGWVVDFSDDTSKQYSGVVIANGRNWYPLIPEIDGHYTGELIHSKDYKDLQQFHRKRVLIIGAGNSGCDLACDAANVAQNVTLSMRRGYYFIPKFVFGIPSDEFADKGPELPVWIERPVFQFLLNKLVVGNLKNYGLPKPNHKLFETHPIMNDQILHHLGHGDIQIKPNLQKCEGKNVFFDDGTEEEYDLIVMATGYQQKFPFISDKLMEIDENGVPDFYLNMFARKSEGLYMVGFLEADSGAYPLIHLQSRLLSKMLKSKNKTPNKYNQLVSLIQSDRPDLRGGISYMKTPRHAYYTKGTVYKRKINRLIRRFD